MAAAVWLCVCPSPIPAPIVPYPSGLLPLSSLSSLSSPSSPSTVLSLLLLLLPLCSPPSPLTPPASSPLLHFPPLFSLSLPSPSFPPSLPSSPPLLSLLLPAPPLQLPLISSDGCPLPPSCLGVHRQSEQQ